LQHSKPLLQLPRPQLLPLLQVGLTVTCSKQDHRFGIHAMLVSLMAALYMGEPQCTLGCSRGSYAIHLIECHTPSCTSPQVPRQVQPKLQPQPQQQQQLEPAKGPPL
jgi:hypothetical protein